MPELPEVETVRRDLHPLLLGRRVESVEVDPASAPLLLGDTGIEAFRAALVGRRFEGIGRRGKYLLLKLDDGNTLVAHLRMTGRLVWRHRADPPEPFQRAAIALDGQQDLRWSDLRKFGTWRIVADPAEAVGKLGPEPVDDAFTLASFRTALAGRSAPIKSVLLDQRRVAGIGNIYADEALFEARIAPVTPAGDIGPLPSKRLHAAVRSVLERGIANRGASFKDYVDGSGEQGQQQMFVQVFRRTGKPCYNCGTLIQRIVVGGRSTHFCPKCQRIPRRRPANAR